MQICGFAAFKLLVFRDLTVPNKIYSTVRLYTPFGYTGLQGKREFPKLRIPLVRGHNNSSTAFWGQFWDPPYTVT